MIDDYVVIASSVSWPVSKPRGWANIYVPPLVIEHAIVNNFPVFVCKDYWSYEDFSMELKDGEISDDQ